MSKRRNRVRRERRQLEQREYMAAANRTLELSRWPDRYRLVAYQLAEVMESDGVPRDRATEIAADHVAGALRMVRLWPAIVAESAE